jgi:menaquinone-dependent protoporphyrinogen oxidase
MNILIATAGRHGSTHEIGAAIAQFLRDAGNAVDVRTVEEAGTVGGYDAAVIGSAVYMGSWMPEARAFVERNHTALTAMPVWLFSSGPIGPQSPGVDTRQIEEAMHCSAVRDHHVFMGKLDRSRLGFGERMAVRLVKAPEGDFRDWGAVRGWSQEIAAALSPTATGVS